MKFRPQFYVSESGGAEKAEEGFRDINEKLSTAKEQIIAST